MDNFVSPINLTCMFSNSGIKNWSTNNKQSYNVSAETSSLFNVTHFITTLAKTHKTFFIFILFHSRFLPILLLGTPNGAQGGII